MSLQSVIAHFQKGLFIPVEGKLVVGKHRKTGAAVVATEGGFDRAKYVQAIQEAKALGLGTVSTIIATGPITYSGPGIHLIRADMEDEFAAADVRDAKMAAVRACRSN